MKFNFKILYVEQLSGFDTAEIGCNYFVMDLSKIPDKPEPRTKNLGIAGTITQVERLKRLKDECKLKNKDKKYINSKILGAVLSAMKELELEFFDESA